MNRKRGLVVTGPGIAFIAVLAAASQAEGQGLAAAYYFENTLASSSAGVPPLIAVDPLGFASFQSEIVFGRTRTVYHWGGQFQPEDLQGGLIAPIQGVIPLTSYSVEIVFTFDNASGINGWRAIGPIRSRDANVDTTTYLDPASRLRFWPTETGSLVVPPNSYGHLVVAVGANGTVRAYMNGSLQYATVSTKLHFTTSEGQAYLFLDEINNGGEWASGRISLLRLYDGPIAQSQVTCLWNDLSSASTARVRGCAYLEGYTASVVGELLEVQIWQNDNLVESIDGNYGPDGNFAFSPTVSGAATLKFRFRTGLWKAVPVTLGPTPIENLTVNMTNGDCDHDNEVGIGDYALLSAIYGLSVGDPGFDTNADLNGDTTVDIADYAILSGSYGEIGD